MNAFTCDCENCDPLLLFPTCLINPCQWQIRTHTHTHSPSDTSPHTCTGKTLVAVIRWTAKCRPVLGVMLQVAMLIEEMKNVRDATGRPIMSEWQPWLNAETRTLARQPMYRVTFDPHRGFVPDMFTDALTACIDGTKIWPTKSFPYSYRRKRSAWVLVKTKTSRGDEMNENWRFKIINNQPDFCQPLGIFCGNPIDGQREHVVNLECHSAILEIVRIPAANGIDAEHVVIVF